MGSEKPPKMNIKANNPKVTHFKEVLDGKITAVTMILNPVIEMPKWNGYSAATKPQKASWDKMYKALLVHEKGHHKVQLGCMEDLKTKIKKTKDLDGKNLNELIANLQKDCQKKQDAYDSKTGHGKSQGVVLNLDA
jgi:predicted secreted Zn-dependent protease